MIFKKLRYVSKCCHAKISTEVILWWYYEDDPKREKHPAKVGDVCKKCKLMCGATINYSNDEWEKYQQTKRFKIQQFFRRQRNKIKDIINKGNKNGKKILSKS